ELALSEMRFRQLCANSPIGIFETDATGQTLYTNPQWQRISGLSESETRGAGWIPVVHPEDRAAMVAEWYTAAAAGRPFDREFRLQVRDGDTRWVHSRSAPLHDEDGTVRGHVGTVEDISEQKRTHEELVRTREAALEVAKLKSQFLANMSHEIRTPMTSIIG